MKAPNVIERQRENRRKWAAALRSGKYQQGEGTIVDVRANRQPRYCCLGVAAAIAGADPAAAPLVTDQFYRAANDAMGIIAQTIFIRLNDTEEKTFPQIADFIEQHEADPEVFRQPEPDRPAAVTP